MVGRLVFCPTLTLIFTCLTRYIRCTLRVIINTSMSAEKRACEIPRPFIPPTSSGSTNLNSIPRPVQTMQDALFGSSNNVTRNCHSCSAPRRCGCGTLAAYPLPPPQPPLSWLEGTIVDSETPKI